MLTGRELGAAIRKAIEKKGVTQREVARVFEVKPPSVQDWMNRGTIGKDKLPALWLYFEDVVGPDHWGLDAFPRWSTRPSGHPLHPSSSLAGPEHRAANEVREPPATYAMDVVTALETIGQAVEKASAPNRKSAISMISAFIENPGANADMTPLIAKRLSGELPPEQQARHKHQGETKA